MKLVEIVPGFCTTRETIEMAKSFLKKTEERIYRSKRLPGILS
jgi:3-hydroxyacyl-CoA dehydrogenase